MRNLNFRILEFQSCSTGVEFEQYYSLVAEDDDKGFSEEDIGEYDVDGAPKHGSPSVYFTLDFDIRNQIVLC